MSREPYFNDVELLTPGSYGGPDGPKAISEAAISDWQISGTVTLPPRPLFACAAIAVIKSPTTVFRYRWVAVDPSLILKGDSEVTITAGAGSGPFGNQIYEDPLLAAEPLDIRVMWRLEDSVSGLAIGDYFDPVQVLLAVTRFRT